MKINENVSLLPLSTSLDNTKISLVSWIQSRLIYQIVLNNESESLVLDTDWAEKFIRYRYWFQLERILRKKFNIIPDICEEKENYFLVDKNARRYFEATFRRQAGAETQTIDYFYIEYDEITYLCDCNYYCRIEKDVFGTPHQVVRRSGEDYCFSARYKFGQEQSTLNAMNVYYEGRTIKEYFRENDFDVAYANFGQRFYKATGYKLEVK